VRRVGDGVVPESIRTEKYSVGACNASWKKRKYSVGACNASWKKRTWKEVFLIAQPSMCLSLLCCGFGHMDSDGEIIAN
jgi:hypothetical protein